MRKAHFTNPARDLFHRIAQGAMQCDAHCSPREPRRADLMRKAAATREGVQGYVESKWATVEKEYNQLEESRRLSTIKRKKDEDVKKDRMQTIRSFFLFDFAQIRSRTLVHATHTAIHRRGGCCGGRLLDVADNALGGQHGGRRCRD